MVGRRAFCAGRADGVIYAGMVGLGFAMIENVGYYINALVTPERGGAALLGYTFVLRGLVSPLLHPIFTSMTGLGVAYSARRRNGAPGAIALGLAAAMVLHGTWNGLSCTARRAWCRPTSSWPACSRCWWPSWSPTAAG